MEFMFSNGRIIVRTDLRPAMTSKFAFLFGINLFHNLPSHTTAFLSFKALLHLYISVSGVRLSRLLAVGVVQVPVAIVGEWLTSSLLLSTVDCNTARSIGYYMITHSPIPAILNSGGKKDGDVDGYGEGTKA